MIQVELHRELAAVTHSILSMLETMNEVDLVDALGEVVNES